MYVYLQMNSICVVSHHNTTIHGWRVWTVPVRRVTTENSPVPAGRRGTPFPGGRKQDDRRFKEVETYVSLVHHGQTSVLGDVRTWPHICTTPRCR